MAAELMQASFLALVDDPPAPPLELVPTALAAAVAIGDLVQVPNNPRRWGEVVAIASRYVLIQWRERRGSMWWRKTTTVGISDLVVMQRRGER